MYEDVNIWSQIGLRPFSHLTPSCMYIVVVNMACVQHYLHKFSPLTVEHIQNFKNGKKIGADMVCFQQRYVFVLATSYNIR